MAAKDQEPPLPKRWIDCEVESDYFGEERKMKKQERKYASSSDRSKYKKTDQRKQTKEKEFKIDKENLKRGRVLSIASQGIIVDIEGKIFNCTLRGVLKKDKTESKNLVTVGDFVLCEKTSSNDALIAHVEPRLTVLSRAENLSRRQSQLIAANIDLVLITTAVVSPPIKPSLVDRYIIAAKKGGMTPIIIINKIDLLQTCQDQVLRDSEEEIYQEMLKAYKNADIQIIAVSTLTGEGISQLKETMMNKSSVFSGQSGVGKSSLINAVTGNSLRVGGMVERTKKGSHTTSSAQLIPLDFGGWCIDTPGIKSFGVWDLDKDEVEQHYPEIFTCGHKCRFPNCSHTGEDGCAVITAVEDGSISYLRYQSYISLILSISENHIRR